LPLIFGQFVQEIGRSMDLEAVDFFLKVAEAQSLSHAS
jgi:hypothetical protein